MHKLGLRFKYINLSLVGIISMIIFGQSSCTNRSPDSQGSSDSGAELLDYSGLYSPEGTNSTTGRGGYDDLPEGFNFKGPEPNVLKSIDPASQDEIALTTKYFEVCEQLLGEFPLPKISCDDPDMIGLPISRTQNGETILYEASDLPPGPPRVIGMEKEQLHALNLLGDATSEELPEFGATRIIKKNRFSNTASAPSISGMKNLAALDNLVKCDIPTPVFRDWKNMGCIAGSSIRRVTTTFKGDPVDWVYICQKNRHSFSDPHLLDDIGMIAHNRGNGATCFYAGTPRATFKVSPQPDQWKNHGGKWPGLPDTDSVDVSVIFGRDIPPPSSKNPESVNHWGMPVPVPCTYCHSAGPWISVPFVNVNQKDGPVLPPRKPGMLYKPVHVTHNPEISAYFNQYKPINPNDDIVKTLENYPSKQPKRLTDPRVSACVSCHHIGSDTYSERFAEMSLILSENFDLSKLPWRSQLYFGNSTDPLALTSGHNQRLKGINTKSDYPHFSPLPIDDYRKSFEFVIHCGRNPEQCEWSDHWILEKVAKKPARYLIELCSTCHHSGKGGELPGLEKPEDFAGDEVKQKIWSRMNDTLRPMPQAGNVEPKILEQLKPFLISRTPSAELRPDVEQIRAVGIDRDQLNRLKKRSIKLREGRPGKDLRVVVVGSGSVGGMAAFNAFSQGADPNSMTVVEMRNDFIRPHIVSAPQDPNVPVNWSISSPLLGGGQSLMQIERTYRAVLEELGVKLSKAIATRVCDNYLLVTKPLSGSVTRNQRTELYQKSDLCRQPDDSVVDLILDSTPGRYKISHIPFDVLLIASGEEGRSLFSQKNGENVPSEVTKDIYKMVKDYVPGLKSLFSASWLFNIETPEGKSCYEDYETNGFKARNSNRIRKDLLAMGLLEKPHSIQASPYGCYLIADIAADRDIKAMKKHLIEKDALIKILKILWPQYQINYPKGRMWPPLSEDITLLPTGQNIFENRVDVVASSIRLTGNSLISCEGDCAMSPFYALKDNLYVSSKSLELTGNIIHQAIRHGFESKFVSDEFLKRSKGRQEIFKQKSWRNCLEIGKRALPSEAQKIRIACGKAVEKVYGSPFEQSVSRFPKANSEWPPAKRNLLNQGRSLVVERCLGCHAEDGPRPIQKGRNWREIILAMNERYLPSPLSQSEIESIADYLESVPSF